MKMGLFPGFIVLVILLMVPLGSSANTFDNLVVYGDSLSDNGNFGRYTDIGGDIWVETLATSLGADLYDYAYGGATTGYDNPAANLGYTGLQWQVDTVAVPSTGNTLFSVWAGANDFLQMRNFSIAAANIGIALDKLYTAGARDILVGNLPDIGLTPSIYGSDIQNLASGWTLGFNFALDSVLTAFEYVHTDANLYTFDAYEMFSTFAPGTAEWLELFWDYDYFHPSSVGHQLIYEAAIAEVAPVPEPSTILLLGSGLAGLAWYSRKRKTA